jgi:outer membrane protein assembly factor BamA
VYQLGSADWMWDRLGSALKSGGEPPAYLDSTTIGADAERLQLFYRQRGFRDAAVSYEVQSRESSGSDEVRVVFEVESGPATYLRRVRYAGLDSLRPAQKRRLMEGTVFDVSSVSLGDTLRISVQSQRYQEPKLLEERRRILSFLQNEGYAAVSRDSVRAVVHRVAPDSFDVTLRVRTGPRYRFGDVHFTATGVETAPPRSDTLGVAVDTTGGYRPQVTVRIEDNDHLKPIILRRSLQFRPGEYYDRSAVQATKRRLENTGVFTFTNLSPQYDAAVRVDTTAYLPIRIEGRTRQRHSVEAEAFALQRESVGGTDTGLPLNEFGVGLSGAYENVNALGGGETFRLRASGSVATGLDSTLVSSNQFEGSVSLILPDLIRPFRPLTQSLDLVNAQTRISLTALTALRSDLGLRIRSRVNANLRLEMDHTPTRSSLIDVMDLSVSNPDTLDQFSTKFLDRVFGPGGGELQDPVQRQQILEDYTQPQVNTALRYTFRAATANPLRRRSGHIYEVSAEVGNTLPLLLDRFVFAPDTLDYSLPSLFGDAGGLTGRLLYRPYVRASVDLRRYVPLGLGTTLGMKLFGGMAHPTARPTVVPFERRFFSGGANSVRGWRLRELGPGEGLPFDTTASVQGRPSNILGGDVKLESSVELRTTLIQDFLAARWAGATFLDAGNVWFGPRNPGFGEDESSADEGGRDGGAATRNGARDGHFRGFESLLDVGVGGGVGLRIEWQYLIVRFDLAYRLHDPSPRNNDVFADDFNGPLLHFGIGQAF